MYKRQAWLPALKNTACKRSTNSTQPQGPVITVHKRPANNTHQSQWRIISLPYHNNTPTTTKNTDHHITQCPEKDKSWSHSYKYSSPKETGPEHRVLLLFSEDAGHRDWRNVRNNNLQTTAKEPKKPRTSKSLKLLPWMYGPFQQMIVGNDTGLTVLLLVRTGLHLGKFFRIRIEKPAQDLRNHCMDCTPVASWMIRLISNSWTCNFN